MSSSIKKSVHGRSSNVRWVNREAADKNLSDILGEKIDSVRDVLAEKISSISQSLGYAATRLEAIIYILKRDGIITEEKMEHAFRRLQDYTVHVERIANGNMSMREKMEEVNKWNANPDNVPMDHRSFGVIDYLLKNPDKLTDAERVSLARLASLGDSFVDHLELVMKKEKEH